jgi:DNA-binding transcriptional ArsR family regulator
MCVCEIRAMLGIARPTVSKHLKLLEGAGLVGRRKESLCPRRCGNPNVRDGIFFFSRLATKKRGGNLLCPSPL